MVRSEALLAIGLRQRVHKGKLGTIQMSEAQIAVEETLALSITYNR